MILINWQHFNLEEIQNCVTFPSSLKSIAYLSFFCVKDLKKAEGLFIFFSVPKSDMLLFDLMERSASATYDISQSELFLVHCLVNVRNNCHFLSCNFSRSFVGIYDIYLENSLFNF